MAQSRAQILAKLGAVLVLCGLIFLFFYFFVCMLIGLSGRDEYVTNRDLRNALTSTECLLLNYTSLKHECTTDGEYNSPVACFDERFQFLYTVANKTQIMSVLVCKGQRTPHKQTEVGTDSLFEH